MKWLQSLLKEPPDANPMVGPDDLAPVRGDMIATASAMSAPPTGPAESIPATEPNCTVDVNSGSIPSPAESMQTTSEKGLVEPIDSAASASAHATQDGFDNLQQRLDELGAAQNELGSRQQELQQLFESRIRSDDVQGRTLETLHDELKQYKANFVRQQMLPVLKEVIFCHDFAVREIERVQNENSASDSPAARTLDVLRQMLVDLLFKYDVEPYRNEGDTFDAKTQQCTKTVPTDNSEQDKKIAAVMLDGFKSPEGIIRREQVAVYKLTPGAS